MERIRKDEEERKRKGEEKAQKAEARKRKREERERKKKEKEKRKEERAKKKNKGKSHREAREKVVMSGSSHSVTYHIKMKMSGLSAMAANFGFTQTAVGTVGRQWKSWHTETFVCMICKVEKVSCM